MQTIFHPSDFSEASEVAFAHALKIALVAGADLKMLHVTDGSEKEWQDFPGVRETLERWKLIPEGSHRSAVAELGIGIRKVIAESPDPVKSCLSYLEKHPADLIVLAHHQHEGWSRWFRKPVGEPLAQKAGQMTLFIPDGVEGFVARQDGSVALRNILIPITTKPSPIPSLEAAARLIRELQLSAGTVTLLHVGEGGDMPALRIPEGTGWIWNRVIKHGEPAEVILQTAAMLAAEMIIMTTDGADGFLDALRGTTSQRVLHKAQCPVMNLPVGSILG